MSKFKLIEAPPSRNQNQNFQIGEGRFGTFGRAGKSRRKRTHRFRIWFCPPSWHWNPFPVDMRIFKLLAAKWKGAPAWSYYSNIWTPVTIAKSAWNAFAAANPYYYTPFKKHIITGYKAYMAWNQAALSAQFLRIQTSFNWNPKYPPVQWPEPPPAYSPIIVTDIAADKDPGWEPVIYTPAPQPPQIPHDALLYTSGGARKGWPETKCPLVYVGTESQDAEEPPPYTYYYWAWYPAWICQGTGIITVGLQLVDRETGSPAPIATTQLLVE